MAIMAYAGDTEAGEHALAPFRALATPIADMVRSMPYSEIYPPDEESYHPIAAGRTMFVDAVDRSAVETIVDRL
ncbi:MAG: FAD-linked oxidase, partial [Actinomycetota bacterium]|nr:FAD-linked oxidase [Actinomycetota bacterium]